MKPIKLDELAIRHEIGDPTRGMVETLFVSEIIHATLRAVQSKIDAWLSAQSSPRLEGRPEGKTFTLPSVIIPAENVDLADMVGTELNMMRRFYGNYPELDELIHFLQQAKDIIIEPCTPDDDNPNWSESLPTPGPKETKVVGYMTKTPPEAAPSKEIGDVMDFLHGIKKQANAAFQEVDSVYAAEPGGEEAERLLENVKFLTENIRTMADTSYNLLASLNRPEAPSFTLPEGGLTSRMLGELSNILYVSIGDTLSSSDAHDQRFHAGRYSAAAEAIERLKALAIEMSVTLPRVPESAKLLAVFYPPYQIEKIAKIVQEQIGDFSTSVFMADHGGLLYAYAFSTNEDEK